MLFLIIAFFVFIIFLFFISSRDSFITLRYLRWAPPLLRFAPLHKAVARFFSLRQFLDFVLN